MLHFLLLAGDAVRREPCSSVKICKPLTSGCLVAGITICSTIHSPTPYCFRLFDRMMILLRGQVVYFGQRGACSNMLSFNAPRSS